jgi:hypothetical protein
MGLNDPFSGTHMGVVGTNYLRMNKEEEGKEWKGEESEVMMEGMGEMS